MAINSPLSIVCVGTGRDGTTSLSQMLQRTFDSEGRGRKSFHEWLSVFFYNHWCAYKENSNPLELEEIRSALASCNIDCIVGNGYAPILPIIAELFNGNIALVHLKRRDREGCVHSLVKNAILYPTNHLYYATSSTANGKRMAAFHFGEISRKEWDSWSLERKFFWYYDKTHALIEESKYMFKTVVEIETESLDEENTRAALAAAIGLKELPPPVHVNQHFDLEFIPELRRPCVQSLLGKLDIARLGYDEVYGIRHVLSEFESWASSSLQTYSFQQTGDTAFVEHLHKVISDAQNILKKHLVSYRPNDVKV